MKVGIGIIIGLICGSLFGEKGFLGLSTLAIVGALANSNGGLYAALAGTIGVSRGVIFNLEKNKTEPQAIVINTICQVLKINKEWLTDGTGGMEPDGQALQSTKLLAELYDIAKELSEDEQLFLLDTVKALKLRLGKRL